MPECIFCDIVNGRAEADVVMTSKHTVAFRDKFPRAPVHVLVTAREHIPSLHEIGPEHADLLVESFEVARDIADREGIGEGYRVATNIGTSGGQAIPHLHFHVIGGRQLGDVG